MVTPLVEGALNDLTHVVTRELMQKVLSPTLIIHSREDASIPFHHAEWSLETHSQCQIM